MSLAVLTLICAAPVPAQTGYPGGGSGDGYPGPADHQDFLLRTSLAANSALDYGVTSLTSGLLASAIASDNYGERVTDADLPISGLHLIHAPFDGHGVATVSLSGAVHLFASNYAPYSAKNAQGYPITYGTTRADAGASVSATASPPNTGPLSGTYINMDQPSNSTYAPLLSPLVLYGGSVIFTSDQLLLNAADPSPILGTTYTWSAFGPGNYYPPSYNSSTWNVVIQAAPGIQTFECLVQAPGALPFLKTLTVEVGIRTDDVIMVGWIDANGVPISSTGVDLPILLDMPSPPVLSVYPPAAARIAALAQNDDCVDYLDNPPLLPLSQADKDYILDWMFKYAANPDPTTVLSSLYTTDWTNPNIPDPTWDNPQPVPVNTSTDFTCYDGYMDYVKYQAFLADPHRFKLLNHFQVKYRVNLANPSQFNGQPTLLHSEALVGATVNPAGIPPDLDPELNFLASIPNVPPFNFPIIAAAWANHTLMDPQLGPANGLIGPTSFFNHISQCNDGSPELPAIRAFNTLMAMDEATPLFWGNIGSKITFNCGQATAVTPPITENYPTYYEYINGVQVFVRPQARSPSGHFYANPYPFGTYPSYSLPPQWPGGLPVFPLLGLGFPTIPGGRNGVATTIGDSTSPIPPYTVP